MEESNKDYITIKDIFLKIGSYFTELRMHLIWIILLGVIFAIVNGFLTIKVPKMYNENLTFMMDDTQGGKGSMFSGADLLGDLFGGKRGGNNLGKILQLFESKKIINNTLFDTINIDGKNDFLANHFLEQYETQELIKGYQLYGLGLYRQQWPRKLLDHPDFKFSHKKIDEFKTIENLHLRLLYEKINGSDNSGIPRLLSSRLDEDTGIMTLSMKSEYEELTLGVLNNIYKQLSKFFVEKSVEKQKKTYNIMKQKRDSVITELKTKEYQLADFKDSNRNLVTVKGYLTQLRLERDVGILNLMYGEVVKQLEATDFALKNKTPVVQIIDLPSRPIFPRKPSAFSSAIKGFLFGAALLVILIITRKFFKDIMQ